MTPTATPLAEQTPALPTIDFGGPTQTIQPCSYNTCSAGHIWMPQMQITQCPGCRAPMLAVKMLQCPICNEPVVKLVFRSEHLPQGGQITPMCYGAASLNEVQVITVARQHAAQEQSKHEVREMISKI